MALPLAPLIVAGGALAQGVVTSAFNMRESQKNRDFQERMSNTAHRREVEDLRAAGLNPVLSAKHGGASTPSGATAQATSPDIMHSAMQAATTQAQIKDLNSAAALKDAQAFDVLQTQQHRINLMMSQNWKTLQDTKLSEEQRNKIIQENKVLGQQLEKLKLDTTHSALDLNRAENESEFQKTLGGDIAPWIKFIKSMVK